METVLKIFISAMYFAALGIFGAKYLYTAMLRTGSSRRIPHKWIGLYQRSSIEGTSSERRRDFMVRSNLMTIAMWLCIMAATVALILGYH